MNRPLHARVGITVAAALLAACSIWVADAYLQQVTVAVVGFAALEFFEALYDSLSKKTHPYGRASRNRLLTAQLPN
jgi:hypothetical protein